jgi:hypothetical protein
MANMQCIEYFHGVVAARPDHSAKEIKMDRSTVAGLAVRGDAMSELPGKERLMGLLEADASYLRPTLFAVYGVDRADRPFLGWGMQFGEDEAIFYQPGSGAVSISTSGEHVHRSHDRRGDACLMWLDD